MQKVKGTISDCIWLKKSLKPFRNRETYMNHKMYNLLLQKSHKFDEKLVFIDLIQWAMSTGSLEGKISLNLRI